METGNEHLGDLNKKKEEYELLHERKVICTCDEDPIWCELHNMDDFS